MVRLEGEISSAVHLRVERETQAINTLAEKKLPSCVACGTGNVGEGVLRTIIENTLTTGGLISRRIYKKCDPCIEVSGFAPTDNFDTDL